jgi:uncharacterized protein (TIGR02246 family)
MPPMKTLLIACCLALAPAALTGQTPAELELVQVETRRFRAMVERDLPTLERILADDLYYIHSDGSVDTRDAFIGAIRDGLRSYEDITIDDLHVRVYHDNTAILNGHCTYHRTGEDGQPNNLRLFYTNVYVKRDGEWRMVSWQSLRL